MVEIERIRCEISVEYNIEIVVICNEESKHSDWAEEDKYITDPKQLEGVSDILGRAFSPFPEGFFHERVTIYIAACFKEIEPEDGTFLLSTDNPYGIELSRQLMDYTVEHFLKEGFTEEDYQNFKSMNPSDFHYGDPNKSYVYHSDDPYDPNSYFLSLSAQDSPEKDIAEILTAVVNNEAFLHDLVPYTCIHDKIKYCCEQLVKWDEKFAAHPGVQIILGEGQFLRNKYKRTAQSLR